MKKIALLVCVILAMVASLVFADGYIPGTSPGRFERLTETNSSAHRVTDATPRWAITFDDGRDGQWDDGLVKHFLRQGIPITLAINRDLVNGVGRLTWNQIRRLQTFAAEQGTPLEIANHSANNWGTHVPSEMTWTDIVDELDNSTFTDSLGVTPTYYATPGAQLAWQRRHINMIRGVLDSLGYKYAELAFSEADTTGLLQWQQRLPNIDGNANPAHGPRNWAWPGMVNDPLYLPATSTFDLGVHVTEVTSGTSGGTEWLIRDQTGGDPDASWEKPIWYAFSAAIGHGASMRFSLHDSVDTDASNIDIGNGSEAKPGHFNFYHLAWVCKQLQDAGIVQFTTASGWAEHILSEYAPGTDLIGNLDMSIAQFAVGDTAGVQYAWMDGMGSIGYGSGSWGVTASYWTHRTYDGFTGARFDVNNDAPGVVDGLAIEGPFGRDGGATMNASMNRFRIVRSMLPPGRYRLSASLNEYRAYAREFQVAVAGTYTRPFCGDAANSDLVTVYGDTLFVTYWTDATKIITGNANQDNTFKDYYFDFEVRPPTLDPGWDSTTATWSTYKETEKTNGCDPLWSDKWWGGVSVEFSRESPDYTLAMPRLVYLGDR